MTNIVKHNYFRHCTLIETYSYWAVIITLWIIILLSLFYRGKKKKKKTVAQRSSTIYLRPHSYWEVEPGWGCRFRKPIPKFGGQAFDVWHPGSLYAEMKTRKGTSNGRWKAIFRRNSISPVVVPAVGFVLKKWEPWSIMPGWQQLLWQFHFSQCRVFSLLIQTVSLAYKENYFFWSQTL